MDLHSQVVELRGQVAELEARLSFLYTHLGVAYAPDPDLLNQPVLALLRAGKYLEAVKSYTDIHHTSLADSKSGVEALKAKYKL